MGDKTGELVERLRREVQKFPATGGGIVSTDGTGSTYITDNGMRLANPDGPEAADLITALRDRVRELEDALGEALEMVEEAATEAGYSITAFDRLHAALQQKDQPDE